MGEYNRKHACQFIWLTIFSKTQNLWFNSSLPDRNPFPESEVEKCVYADGVGRQCIQRF